MEQYLRPMFIPKVFIPIRPCSAPPTENQSIYIFQSEGLKSSRCGASGFRGKSVGGAAVFCRNGTEISVG